MARTKGQPENLSKKLHELVDQITLSYKEDLESDLERMKTLFRADAANYFYVLIRRHGTYAFRVRDIYLNNTFQQIAWLHYAEEYPDGAKIFGVKIDHLHGGDIFGFITPISFEKSAEDVKKHKFDVEHIDYCFADKTTETCPANCPLTCDCEAVKGKINSGIKLLQVKAYPREKDELRFEELIRSREQQISTAATKN